MTLLLSSSVILRRCLSLSTTTTTTTCNRIIRCSRLFFGVGGVVDVRCNTITTSSSNVCRQNQQRWNNTSSSTTTIPPRLVPSENKLPIRHSRHDWTMLPICYDDVQLHELTCQFMEQDDRTVFDNPNNVSHEADLFLWTAKIDSIVQMAEYTVRGHAACIPNTVYSHHRNRYYNNGMAVATDRRGNNNNSSNGRTTTTTSSSSSSSSEYHIACMEGIINHLIKQNEVYMTLRKQLLSSSQQVVVEHTWTTNDDDDDDDKGDVYHNYNYDNNEQSSIVSSAAGPGPTIVMYDALLDSMAVTMNDNANTNTKRMVGRVETMGEMLRYQILHRHGLDGGPTDNTNPATVPTVRTFNAILRTIANSSSTADNTYDNEGTTAKNDDANDDAWLQLRDDSLGLAWGVYDEMRHHVDRNAATYTYMLDIVRAFLPPSTTRGNVSHGLWTMAKDEGVASVQVLDALKRTNTPSNGRDFDVWVSSNNDIRKMPLQWRRNYKLRRFRRNDATY